MVDYSTKDTSLADWLTRLSQYLYVTELIAGKRVIEVGCGAGDSARFLADHGAAQVVAIDGSAGVIDRARRRHRADNLWFRHENLTALELDDDSCECVLVPDGVTAIQRPAVLEELRRVLVPNGHLVVAAPSADRAVGAAGLSYHQLSDTLEPLFGPVQMVAQSPFIAMSLVAYAESDVADVELDTSLIDWARAPEGLVTGYMAVCGGGSESVRGFTVVQLPIRPGVDLVERNLEDQLEGSESSPRLAGGQREASTPEGSSNGTISAQISQALYAHAQLTRELERTLAEQQAFNEELHEDLALASERADLAENVRRTQEVKLVKLEHDIKSWRTRASVAEGEMMRIKFAQGTDPGVEAEAMPALAGPSLAGPALAGPNLAGPNLAGPNLAGPNLAAKDQPEAPSAAATVDGDGNGADQPDTGQYQDVAALRQELAETRKKLERATRNWHEAENKNDSVWRRVGDLQRELEEHREQAIARSAEARRTAQLDMAKAMEESSSKLLGAKEQLSRCEKRCAEIEEECAEAIQARADLQRRLEKEVSRRKELERVIENARAAAALREEDDTAVQPQFGAIEVDPIVEAPAVDPTVEAPAVEIPIFEAPAVEVSDGASSGVQEADGEEPYESADDSEDDPEDTGDETNE